MHTFAAVPVLPESPFKNQIKLGYQPLFYSNLGKVVALVKIDFMDGLGYQTIYNNGTKSTISKIYSDSSGYKKFVVKVIYTDNSLDECYTQQFVNVITDSIFFSKYDPLTPEKIKNPDYIVQPTSYLNVNPTIPFNAQIPFLQNLQQFNQNMKLYIRFSSKRNGTGLQDKIVKPFIIVEGYDITDASPLLKAENYGLNNLLEEWDKIVTTPNTFDIHKKLDEEGGYDLIFIDYYTMRSITENADYLLQAIDWINSNKENNAVGVREQNVIMGISMGGLVSRYALAKRTKQIDNTETRQLITMDSPHQGSNVPLGLQHFLYDLGETKIIAKLKSRSDELKAFYNLNE